MYNIPFMVRLFPRIAKTWVHQIYRFFTSFVTKYLWHFIFSKSSLINLQSYINLGIWLVVDWKMQLSKRSHSFREQSIDSHENNLLQKYMECDSTFCGSAFSWTPHIAKSFSALHSSPFYSIRLKILLMICFLKINLINLQS